MDGSCTRFICACVSIKLCINACEIYVCKWCATKDVQLKDVVPCFEFQLHVLQSCRETFTTSQVVTWQTSQLQIWLVQMCLEKPWKVAGRSPLVKLAWLKSKRLLCFEICEFHGQFKSCVPGLFSSYKRILIKIIGTPQRKTAASNHGDCRGWSNQFPAKKRCWGVRVAKVRRIGQFEVHVSPSFQSLPKRWVLERNPWCLLPGYHFPLHTLHPLHHGIASLAFNIKSLQQ